MRCSSRTGKSQLDHFRSVLAQIGRMYMFVILDTETISPCFAVGYDAVWPAAISCHQGNSSPASTLSLILIVEENVKLCGYFLFPLSREPFKEGRPRSGWSLDWSREMKLHLIGDLTGQLKRIAADSVLAVLPEEHPPSTPPKEILRAEAVKLLPVLEKRKGSHEERNE